MRSVQVLCSSVFLIFLLLAPLADAQISTPVAARDYVLDDLLQGETAGKRILVHPDLLAAGTEIHAWHTIPLVTPAEGYVVFIDDFAYANFEHPCRYVFVDPTFGATQVVENRTPPREMAKWLEMETVAYQKIMSAKNVRAPRIQRELPTGGNSEAGELYAVLMSGGANSSNNHVRYWNDLSNIYITLVDVYAYKDQNIIVLCSDGLDPTPDQSNGQNSDPDLDGDGDDDIMYSCTYANIQAVFNNLATTLTSQDQLFVFTTDHGGSNGGWDTYLNLWNMETMLNSSFETILSGLPPCDIICTMEQCFSGGFMNSIPAPTFAFSSACSYTEYSWAMPPDYVYDTYVFFWTAAVKGEDAYGVPCNADLNGDTIISMNEAFIYAEAEDFSSETPQYSENPTGAGDTLFLGPGPALTMRFPAGLPTGYQPPGPDATISIEIKDGLEHYVPGTGRLHYRFDPAASYATVSFVPQGANIFEVTLPNTAPGDMPEFFFSAQGDQGTTILSPSDAPTSVYSFSVALVETILHDDFETATGWTVEDLSVTTGTWERCVPNVTSGDQVAPLVDNPAGTGTYCFATENGPANAYYADHDIDGGPTRLISPTIDLSSGDALISAYIWFYGRDGDDPFTIEVSNNNGTTWTTVHSTNSSMNGWTLFSFAVSDFVVPNNQIKVRYSAQDQPNNSITEAGLDDFRVERINLAPSIWAGVYKLSAAMGGQVPLHLDAGSAYASREYLVGASMSGSYPGLTLPGGNVMPINLDWFTKLVYRSVNTAKFQSFQANLDSQGTGTALLDSQGPINPAYVGTTLTFAFTLTGSYDYVSNPVHVEIEP